tara:strand:- start:2384 stop:3034 length:651 start_codon:yes stop_codon:yes gene_type:complete
MNLKHYVWVFKGALAPDVCDRIIKIALGKQKQQGLIHGIGMTESGGYKDLKKHPLTEKQKKDLLEKRDCRVVWLEEPWLYSLLSSYIRIANKNAEWNFHWDWTESSQFIIYKKHQFYSWHTDSAATIGGPLKGSYGKIRKLSSNILLSDPSTYDGGDFQIDHRMQDPDIQGQSIWTAPRERGTIMVFPSFSWHRATPITKGIRYSITHWHWGQPWK